MGSNLKTERRMLGETEMERKKIQRIAKGFDKSQQRVRKARFGEITSLFISCSVIFFSEKAGEVWPTGSSLRIVYPNNPWALHGRGRTLHGRGLGPRNPMCLSLRARILRVGAFDFLTANGGLVDMGDHSHRLKGVPSAKLPHGQTVWLMLVIARMKRGKMSPTG